MAIPAALCLLFLKYVFNAKEYEANTRLNPIAEMKIIVTKIQIEKC